MPDKSGSQLSRKFNKAILVNLDLNEGVSVDERLDELCQLATSDKLNVVAVVEGKRLRPDPSMYVGSGKANEIAQKLGDTESDMVIFNHDLTPAQQRNLMSFLKVPVIDRTSLILDIFAQRAKSHEGKLQVELAQLEHLATRLVRG